MAHKHWAWCWQSDEILLDDHEFSERMVAKAQFTGICMNCYNNVLSKHNLMMAVEVDEIDD